MYKLFFKSLTGVILTLGILASVHAEVAQEPMLTRSSSVPPNLVLMFDDSGSMDNQYIYQFGGTQGGNGRSGPGVTGNTATCPTAPTITTTCTYRTPPLAVLPDATVYPTWVSGTRYAKDTIVMSPVNSRLYKRTSTDYSTKTNRNKVTADPSTSDSDIWDPYTASTTSSGRYYELSPDVNRLHYDPRILYRTRVDSAGNSSTPGTPTTDTFNVFFYMSGATNTTNTIVWPGSGNDPAVLTSYLSTYTPVANVLAPGATTGLSYPRDVTSATGLLPKFLKRTDCNGGANGGSCSLAEERQNYANWKKYHSNRLDLVKTGLGYAFRNIGSSLRLGWSTINALEEGTLASGVSLFDQAHKDAFYTWLYAQQNPGNTPNRLALKAVGEYYSRVDNFGPWATTPTPSSISTTLTISASSPNDTLAMRQAHASCRRSYGMLVTDGYYNDDSTTVGVGDFDYSTSIPTITGTSALGASLTFTYNGRTKPYAQEQANTFADVAMKFWASDLRPDLPNRVKVIPDKVTPVTGAITRKGNESFWQNMSFYAVGLGIYGTLPPTTTTLASLSLSSGGTAWPTVAGSGETAVDDMWHATINGRGQMLSAKNADELSDSIEAMLADINKQASSQAGVAISTANLTIGTRKYTPRYETGSWTGNVVARNLDPNTGTEISTAWQVVGTSSTGGTTVTYSNNIPSHTTRTIVTWTGSSAEAFTNTTAVTNNMTAPVTANLIDYLRGDQSNEGDNGLALYRPREVLLGDIVNSTPVFVKGEVDMKYDTLPSTVPGTATYRSFFDTKAARTEGAVFVGSNDGMLHAFRENTGAEVFAYIPQAVLPNLHRLASKNYTHRYFVDGPIVETDAYFSTPGVWKNLILGTTGAGAKAVFALDVTNPVNMDATKVLWEISSTSNANFSELGHVLSDVTSGITENGTWVTVFGNGYDSTSGLARLYVINMLTGAYIKHIDVGTVGGNGLGAVRLVRNDKQQIVGAYAGDLKGKMWKFDLTGSSGNWQAGLNGTALYDAGTTKPITAAPAVIPNPGVLGGNIIAFATGKLFENTDISSTATQSVYGVLDTVPFGSATYATTTAVLTSLVQQTIVSSGTASRTVTSTDLTTSVQAVSFYTVSQNPVTLSASIRGWYIDLPNDGQRTVYPIDKLSNRYIGVDTISPLTVTSRDPCTQGAQGVGWLYFMDGLTGGGPNEAIIDTNGDGQVNSADSISSGISTTADGRNISVLIESRTNSTRTTYANMGGGTGSATVVQLTCRLLGTCRSGGVSGTIKSREWRQLFLR
jgi:type IV pilus assembly protein PilY1